MPVVIPPAQTQTAIAEALGALDEKVAIHEKIVAITAALRDVLTLLITPHR